MSIDTVGSSNGRIITRSQVASDGMISLARGVIRKAGSSLSTLTVDKKYAKGPWISTTESSSSALMNDLISGSYTCTNPRDATGRSLT